MRAGERRWRRGGLAGLSEFLQETALLSGDSDTEEARSREGVRLVTMHAAKGLEFEVVCIAGVQPLPPASSSPFAAAAAMPAAACGAPLIADLWTHPLDRPCAITDLCQQIRQRCSAQADGAAGRRGWRDVAPHAPHAFEGRDDSGRTAE